MTNQPPTNSTPPPDQHEAQLQVARWLMDKWRNVLRALAK